MPIYIHTNQQTSGPFEDNVVAAWLQAGQISPEVLACPQGSTEWRPVRTIFPGPAQPPVLAGAQPQSASPIPDQQAIASWARLSLRNRVEVKVPFNSIAARVFAYGVLLLLPAGIAILGVVDMFNTGNFADLPRRLLIDLAVALPFLLFIFVIQLTKRNLATYLDAEGIQTMRGKKHRWESLQFINYKKVGGLTAELFFLTGKALIPSRAYHWRELFALVETIPVRHRR